MTVLFNLDSNKNIRRNLRQQGVRAEIILWSKLRNKNLEVGQNIDGVLSEISEVCGEKETSPHLTPTLSF